MNTNIQNPYRLPGGSNAHKLEATAPMGVVLTHGKWKLNLALPVWKFSRRAFTLDWQSAPMSHPGLLNATKRYFAWLVTKRSEATINYVFTALTWLTKCPSFINADQMLNGSDGTITHEMFLELTRVMKHPSWGREFNAVRRWYKWCLDRHYTGFSEIEWPRINDMLTQRPEAYRTVTGPAANELPLTTTEKRQLIEALRLARANETVSLESLIPIWIMFYRGVRPQEIADMTVADLKRAGNQYMIWVPFVKKQTHRRQGGGRDLRIPSFLGRLIQAMIEEQQKARQKHGLIDSGSGRWPLFPRQKPDITGHIDPMDAWFGEGRHIITRLKYSAKLLGLDFELGAHRLRNTFALDLVMRGACPEELRIELGHSTDHWILKYYHPGDAQVEMLDAVERERLGAILQNLQQNIITGPNGGIAKVKGGLSRSRIRYGDPKKGIFVGVGECGCAGSRCAIGIANTLNCYTCMLFHPFRQGNHNLILDQVNNTIDEMRIRGADAADLLVWLGYRRAISHVCNLCN